MQILKLLPLCLAYLVYRHNSFSAAREIFPNAESGLCFFHVMQKLMKELPKSNIYKNTVKEIQEDVRLLARARSAVEFAIGFRTMIKHWEKEHMHHEIFLRKLANFIGSCLTPGDVYHQCYYRNGPESGTMSLATNCGHEGMNSVLKAVCTQRALQGFSRHLLQLQQIAEEWSRHPEKQTPALLPKIDQSPQSKLRKGMLEIRKEKRPFIHIREGNNNIWLVPSSTYLADIREQKTGIEELWRELNEKTTVRNAAKNDFVYESWQWYKERRTSFFELQRHHVYEGFLSCTCPIGITDVPCKHSVVKMEDLNLIQPKSSSLQIPRKRGRPGQVGHALAPI